jgi:hypothetical protein
MCCVALFCVVPRPSDTSIGVLGFVTRSTVRECYDKARIFHFLTFIYHVYYYSRSHDRRVFTFAHDSLRVFPWTAFPIRLDITHPSTPLTQY